MDLTPLNDNVLIEPEPDPTYAEHTGTSLVIPDSARYGPVDLPKWGKVIARGPDTKGIVQVGDRVLYGKFSWAKVIVEEGKHMALVRELDLLAVDA